MGYKPAELPAFGGLNLAADPQEVGWGGAVDLLNIDLDRSGRVRQRDGYTTYTHAAAAAGYQVIGPSNEDGMVYVSRTDGRLELISGFSVVATSSPLADGDVTFASIGTATDSYVFAAHKTVAGWRVYNGTAWSTPAGPPNAAGLIAVQPNDNRLVLAEPVTSKVSFSNAGDPLTWSASDYVYLTPGDGERIVYLVAWQNYLFVFKETKFFVFYGNSIDETGGPVFNYRTVNGVGGVEGNGVALAPEGVYFASYDGIYLTSGGGTQYVSDPIRPLFGASTAPAEYGGETLRIVSQSTSMTYATGRVYLAVRDYSAVTIENSIIFVYDTHGKFWVVWAIPSRGIGKTVYDATIGPELLFSATDTNHVMRVSKNFSADNTAPIASYYQTGYADLGDPEQVKTVRRWGLDGTGTVNVSVGENDGPPSSDTRAADVTLGTGTQVDTGWHLKSYKARNFSLRIGSNAAGDPWSVSRAVAYLRSQRTPGRDDE